MKQTSIRGLVSIVILNYNGGADTDACLASLTKQTYKQIEVIVVDNNSVSTKRPLTKPDNYSFPLRYIWHNCNSGFAGGCNIGAENARGEYVALLNNDTLVDRKWIEALVRVIKSNDKIGIVVGKIYRITERPQKTIFDSAGSLFNQIGSAWSRGYLEADSGQYDKEEEVPMATAGGCLFRRSILDKTYLFDEDFFMYMEELDFCLRVRQLGYKIIYTPDAIVYHKFSRSVQRVDSNVVLFKQFHGNRARMKILAKYYPITTIIVNFHLIILSFLYWDIYFLRFGGLKKLWELKYNQCRYLFKGLRERRSTKKVNSWTRWIVRQSFLELLAWARESRQREKLVLL